MRKPLIALVIGGGLFASGYLLAQNPKEVIDKAAIAKSVLKPSEDPRFQAQLLQDTLANLDKYPDSPEKEKARKKAEDNAVDFAIKMRGIYLKNFADAAAHPSVAPEISGRAIEMYDKEVRSAKSAVQATEASGELSLHLQAVQVVQNARIIELLGQLVAQKK
ncbi:hypothetical protein LBMAG21_08050 [Armatimonadota bacterium]|nr:hypothetical protein LBMAG21_08050 [Armatimonadota bacterium]